MLEFGFPCYTALHENAAELHGGGTALECVYDGERVFPFVEVFAEAFCFCVLRSGAKMSAVTCRRRRNRTGTAHIC